MPLSNKIGSINGLLIKGLNEVCIAYNNVTEAFDFCHNGLIKNATMKVYIVDMNVHKEVPYESLVYLYKNKLVTSVGISLKDFHKEAPKTLQEILVPIHTIYIDMDEVIVNFKKAIIDANPQANVKEMYEVADVLGVQRKLMAQWIPNMIKEQAFANAEPLPFFYILKETLIPYWKSIGIEVQILSSLSSDSTVQSTIATQKLRWIQKHEVDIKFNFVKGASLKQEFAKPGTLLLDDYQRTINQFINAGGCAILVPEDTTSVMRKLSILGLCP